MIDIVERLRAYSAEEWASHPLRREAADEIEQMQAALREAARRLIANGDGYGAAEAIAVLEPKP